MPRDKRALLLPALVIICIAAFGSVTTHSGAVRAVCVLAIALAAVVLGIVLAGTRTGSGRR